MSQETSPTAFVCPECGAAIQRPTAQLLNAVRVNCDICGHEISLDRRGAKDSDDTEASQS